MAGLKGARSSFTMTNRPRAEGWCSFLPGSNAAGKGQRQQIVVQRDCKTERNRSKAALQLPRDLAEHVVAKEKAAKQAAALLGGFELFCGALPWPSMHAMLITASVQDRHSPAAARRRQKPCRWAGITTTHPQ